MVLSPSLLSGHPAITTLEGSENVALAKLQASYLGRQPCSFTPLLTSGCTAKWGIQARTIPFSTWAQQEGSSEQVRDLARLIPPPPPITQGSILRWQCFTLAELQLMSCDDVLGRHDVVNTREKAFNFSSFRSTFLGPGFPAGPERESISSYRHDVTLSIKPDQGFALAF